MKHLQNSSLDLKCLKNLQLFLKIKCAPTLNRWGVLCKKWCRSLLGREISCSQWEGPSVHSRCLAFFPFMFGGWRGGRAFFHFSRLPNVFTLCSFQVPNGFPIFSPYLLTFIPYALENGVLLSPI